MVAIAVHVHVRVDVGPYASPAWARMRVVSQQYRPRVHVPSLCGAAVHVCLYKCPIWPVWWWRRFGLFGGVRTRGLWRRRVGTRRDMLRALGVLPPARGGVGRESGSDALGSDSDGSDDEWLHAGVLDAGD